MPVSLPLNVEQVAEPQINPECHNRERDMPITSQIYEEKQLTVFAATGELSFAEVRNAITSLSGLDESIPAMDEALSWLA